MAKSKRGDGPNKMQLVRDALAELGGKAKPKAIQEWVKEKSGVLMSTTMISSYKTSISKSGKRGRKRGRGPGRPAAAAGGAGKSVSLNDLNAVKTLIDRVGVTKLGDLIKLLS